MAIDDKSKKYVLTEKMLKVSLETLAIVDGLPVLQDSPITPSQQASQKQIHKDTEKYDERCSYI